MSYHNYRASVDGIRCLFCNLPESEHTCSVCGASDKQLQKMAGMLYCQECMEKEEAAQKELEATKDARVAERVNPATLPQPDTSITVLSDIFNAKIALLEDIRKEIDADESIVNKHFALAERLQTRYEHLKQVIIDAQKVEKDAQSESRTILTYYNDLAKKLKEDERAKIRLNDTQYQPPVKPTKTPKAPTVKKYNKTEIREMAAKSGIPEAMLTQICLSRNCPVTEAVQVYRQVMGLPNE